MPDYRRWFPAGGTYFFIRKFSLAVFAKTIIIILASHETYPECNRRIGKLASFGVGNHSSGNAPAG